MLFSRFLPFALTAGVALSPGISVFESAHAQASVKSSNPSNAPSSVGKKQVPSATPKLDPGQKLVMDSAIVRGTLPNGLRYFIRQNKHPEQRAELRLVVNAGSVLEDDDQRGLAHFVEHMAFNGTKSFAKHDIIGYLQSVGMKFGADLNASTSYDETVYKLTVPTDGGGEVLSKGIQILEEWAHEVVFDSAEVMAERGVILEERRMRDGVGLRMAAGRDSALFQGTPYASRLPIGTPRSIQEATPSLLKRFYKDWYRPDLMSVVVVGDFDPRQVEALVKTHFSDIPKATSPRPRPTYALKAETPSVTLLQDNRQQTWVANIYFPKTAKIPQTVHEYRTHIADRLLVSVLGHRLATLPRLPKSPVIAAQFAVSSLRRNVPVYTLSVQAKQYTYEQAVSLALAEIERIAKFGVTATELNRAAKQMIANTEAGNVGNESRTSAEYANDYVQVALNPDAVAMSNKAAVALVSNIAPTVTSADIQALAQSIRANKTPLFVGMTPVPWGNFTDSMVVAAMRQVDTMTLSPYEDSVGSTPLLATTPTAGKVVNEREFKSLNVTEWTLSNGVRVLLKPTTLSPGRFDLRGFKFGGSSLADDVEYINAGTAAAVVGMSGVGTFTNDEIKDKLAGSVVGVGTSIERNAISVTGQAASQDLSAFFELLYMKFTEPRIDTIAVRNWQNVNRTRGMDALQWQMNRYLTGENPRARPIFGRMVDSVDTDKALTFYKERFGDASGFTFAIVGDFDLQTIKPFVEQYIGGLPAQGKTEMFVDHNVRPSTGPIRRILTVNTPDPVSRSQIVYTGPVEFSRKTQRELGALATVVQMRLTEKLREELGGTYTVQAKAEVGNEPYSFYRLTIAYTSAPQRTNEMRDAVAEVVDSLRRFGPTAAELQAAKEEQRRAVETSRQQNGYWTGMLIGYVRNGWDLEALNQELTMSADFTAERLHEAAKQYLVDDHSIFVASVPAGYQNSAAERPAAPPTPASAAPATTP